MTLRQQNFLATVVETDCAQRRRETLAEQKVRDRYSSHGDNMVFLRDRAPRDLRHYRTA